MLPIAIAVVEQDGQVLIGPRAANLPLGGLWEFPGGKIGTGESPANAAVRECREETGVDVDVLSLDSTVEHSYQRADQPPLCLRLHFYRCRPRAGTPAPRPPFRWVAASSLDSYEFPAANRSIVVRLRKGATMNIVGHELVGARLVGQMPSRELVEMWIRITSAIVKQGFAIEYRDLEPPKTGIFDGLRIVLDPDVGFEMQCFILLHLFGHSVQWVAPSIEHKLQDLQHTQDKQRFMQVLKEYEYEAAGFGMQLLHEAGVTGLDQWYSDFVATDWRYVERYYEEGKIPPWNQCIAQDCPLLRPLAIPELRLHQVAVRFAF